MSSRKWRKINAYGSYEVSWSPWGQMEPGTGQMLPDNWSQLPVGNEPESFFCALQTTLAWVQFLGRENPLEKEMATTSVFLPGEFHGQRSLADYSSWGCKSQTGLMCKREISGNSYSPHHWSWSWGHSRCSSPFFTIPSRFPAISKAHPLV